MGPQLYRCGNRLGSVQNLIPTFASMGPQLYRCGNSSTYWVNGGAELLQWGRNFIVAEIRESMVDFFLLTNRFNGAATLSLRKSVYPNKEINLQNFASMGPQLYRCGNKTKTDKLNFNSDASMGPQLYRCGNGVKCAKPLDELVASMGPQLYRCGNLYDGHSGVKYAQAASMGPQLYRCGNR